MVWQIIYRYVNHSVVYSNIILMIYSFNSAGDMIHFDQFTLAHYQSLFKNERLMAVIFNTVAVALLAASVATMIGTMGAIALYHLRKKN